LNSTISGLPLNISAEAGSASKAGSVIAPIHTLTNLVILFLAFSPECRRTMASIYPIHIPDAKEILVWCEKSSPCFPLLERAVPLLAAIT
jgi:hypothetical protein